MAGKKTIFIVPGYKHQPIQKTYLQLSDLLRNEGYYPIVVTIPWSKRTLSQNTDYFLKQYKKVRRKNKYILGFSFGAMIAFLASTQVSVSGLILCSLSPYFKEDLPRRTKKNKSIWKKRHEDFSTLPFKKLSKQLKTQKILMLYGVQEASALIHRVEEAFDKTIAPYKFLFPIQHTDHNISNKNYLQTIHRVTKEFI